MEGRGTTPRGAMSHHALRAPVGRYRQHERTTARSHNHPWGGPSTARLPRTARMTGIHAHPIGELRPKPCAPSCNRAMWRPMRSGTVRIDDRDSDRVLAHTSCTNTLPSACRRQRCPVALSVMLPHSSSYRAVPGERRMLWKLLQRKLTAIGALLRATGVLQVLPLLSSDRT